MKFAKNVSNIHEIIMRDKTLHTPHGEGKWNGVKIKKVLFVFGWTAGFTYPDAVLMEKYNCKESYAIILQYMWPYKVNSKERFSIKDYQWSDILVLSNFWYTKNISSEFLNYLLLSTLKIKL